jgi:hypothetical protein
MFWKGKTTPLQKRGVIICLPKERLPQSPEDFRPITLLNNDYKILARLVTNRLQTVITAHLPATQFCGVHGNTILDAVATIRDSIAYAEYHHTPLCVISLDFRNAFDRISHDYLFKTLRAYGIDEPIIAGLRHLYEGATSLVQVNGQLYGPIPIHCAVRQGCPMSMALYTLCLHPLLQMMKHRLHGIRLPHSTSPISVVAYADDVTIFATSPADLRVIDDALTTFERASGSQINPQKSKALPIGGWTVLPLPRGIAYHTAVTILGINFRGTMKQTMVDTWTRVTAKVRAHAKEAYTKGPFLADRITYANMYLLSKIWYTAQILAAPKSTAQQLQTAITWYIWKGAIFRVPITTLQKSKRYGGWGFVDIAAKCSALLLGRMHSQSRKAHLMTAQWLKFWHLHVQPSNPPNMQHIPASLPQLREYASIMAYITPPRPSTAARHFRRQIYHTVHVMLSQQHAPQPMRIEQLFPHTPWEIIWLNWYSVWTSDEIKSVWYVVLHDLVPTNVRLAKIKLKDSPRCGKCGRQDTLQHRLTQCGNATGIWQWTREKMACILQTDPRNIPPDWLTRPSFLTWPRTRQVALLWILAHMTYYVTQHKDRLSLMDYADFLRRARWKAYNDNHRLAKIGTYLDVL